MSLLQSGKPFLAVAAIVLLATLVIRHFHWDDRLYYWLDTHSHADDWRSNSVWLDDYRVVTEARALPGVLENLSGLSFDPERRQLWAVTNGPNELLALSLEGKVLSRHPLNGFHDVEGVVYLGDGQLAVVEERRQTILVIPTPGAPGELERQDFAELRFELHREDNKEYEGLAYDPAGDRLLVAKERDPIRLYAIEGFLSELSHRFSLAIQNVTGSLGRNLFVNDLSGLTFDSATGHLLALSDESKLLVELSSTGKVISYIFLTGGFSGLKRGIPQAEGVALDDRGRLYVVSEPNLFYRFEKAVTPPPEA